MKDKITKDNAKRIDTIEKEIHGLYRQINDRELEIENIYVESNLDFTGSYAEYFDGDEYVFMKVERQYNRIKDGKHHGLNLQGPAIRLTDNPLNEEIEDGENVIGHYDNMDGIMVGSKVLEGVTVETLRKISKKDMEHVVKVYTDMLKKNML